MTAYQKATCVLLALAFALLFGGSIVFEAGLPILGLILSGSGILSFLSILLVLRRERQKQQEEESGWHD